MQAMKTLINSSVLHFNNSAILYGTNICFVEFNNFILIELLYIGVLYYGHKLPVYYKNGDIIIETMINNTNKQRKIYLNKYVINILNITNYKHYNIKNELKLDINYIDTINKYAKPLLIFIYITDINRPSFFTKFIEEVNIFTLDDITRYNNDDDLLNHNTHQNIFNILFTYNNCNLYLNQDGYSGDINIYNPMCKQILLNLNLIHMYITNISNTELNIISPDILRYIETNGYNENTTEIANASGVAEASGTSRKYYDKYIKYKNKYLELRSKYLNFYDEF
jgi:hypothetical protein